MAGFRNSACGLQAPDFGKYEANSPSVSGHYRENSRFQETAAGDRVRSPLAWRQQSMAIIPVGDGVGKKIKLRHYQVRPAFCRVRSRFLKSCRTWLSKSLTSDLPLSSNVAVCPASHT